MALRREVDDPRLDVDIDPGQFQDMVRTGARFERDSDEEAHMVRPARIEQASGLLVRQPPLARLAATEIEDYRRRQPPRLAGSIDCRAQGGEFR